MKKKILSVIILIIILLCALFYWKQCPKTENMENFALQGETEISSGFIRMKVWDNEAEDGDTISVYFDGKLLEKNLGILNKPFVIELGKISKGEHLFGVKAINEGTTSPASASMSIYNESEEKEFAMDATKEQPASWKIIVK